MQVNYKEWYLVELYSRIVGPLGADRAANALIEIREHLEESESAYIARGLDPQLATQAAIDQVGTPSRLARSFVLGGTSRELGTWTVVCFIAVILGGPLLSTVRHGIGDGMGFLFLLCLPVIAAIRTKQPLRLGLTALAGFLVLAFLCFNNSNQLNVSSRGTTDYDHVHRGYLQLKQEHEQMLKLEGEIAAQLREKMSQQTASPNAKVLIQGVYYKSWFGRYELYPGGRMYSLSDVAGDPWARFSSTPLASQRTVVASKLKAVAQVEIERMASVQAERKLLLASYERGLNTPRLHRALMYLPREILYSVTCVLVAWGSSYLVSLALIKSMTRRRKLVG